MHVLREVVNFDKLNSLLSLKRLNKLEKRFYSTFITVFLFFFHVIVLIFNVFISCGTSFTCVCVLLQVANEQWASYTGSIIYEGRKIWRPIASL